MRRLHEKYELDFFADRKMTAKAGFGQASIDGILVNDAPVVKLLGGRLLFQKGVLSAVLRGRPDVVLVFANPRFLSYWMLLLLCRLLGIRIFSHGQGLYSAPRAGKGKRLMYRLMCWLSTRYLCYSHSSEQSLLAAGCPPGKLAVVENSLELGYSLPPEEKGRGEPGILFIGRLRHGNRLEDLIEAVRNVRKEGLGVQLHVIGGGDQLESLRAEHAGADWISWYGAVMDERHIADISKCCRIGCYPGDAGLSVVHMFSLSLPPLIHDELPSHMGPEPSYVQHMKNGFLFPRGGGAVALQAAIKTVWQIEDPEMEAVVRASYASYVRLSSPSWSERMMSALEEDDRCNAL